MIRVSERVIVVLTPSKQFFSYIMARTRYILIRWWWGLLWNKPTHLDGLLAHWNNILQVDMSLHLGHIILSQPIFVLSP